MSWKKSFTSTSISYGDVVNSLKHICESWRKHQAQHQFHDCPVSPPQIPQCSQGRTCWLLVAPCTSQLCSAPQPCPHTHLSMLWTPHFIPGCSAHLISPQDALHLPFHSSKFWTPHFTPGCSGHPISPQDALHIPFHPSMFWTSHCTPAQSPYPISPQNALDIPFHPRMRTQAQAGVTVPFSPHHPPP